MTSFRALSGPGFDLPRLSRIIIAVLLVAVIAGCATRKPAPIEDRGAYPAKPAPMPPMVIPPPPAASLSPQPQPQPDTRAATYTVKRGDTLYAIALDNGLDYRDLAAWNSIDNVNLIRVGQVLRLSAPGEPPPEGIAAGPGVTTIPLRPPPPVIAGDGKAPPTTVQPAAPAAQPVAPAAQPAAPAAPPLPRNAENYKSQPKAGKEPYSERALRDMQQRQAAGPAAGTVVATAPQADGAPPAAGARADPKTDSGSEPHAAGGADDDSKVNWLWPTEGKVITGFSDTENLKGIDIAGKTGQPIFAAAAGKVVYAGTGLRGYGKLIIVKHNNSYLSAYAHNKDILVKEGQQVTRGQKIAEMGNTDSDQVKLHFEIRRMGKPIDPLKQLPPA